MSNLEHEYSTNDTLANLSKLGFAFRLEGLALSDSTWKELSDLSQKAAQHLRDTRGISALGLDLWITEIPVAPDAGGWVRERRKLEHPYWYSKSGMDDFRRLHSFLDELASSST